MVARPSVPVVGTSRPERGVDRAARRQAETPRRPAGPAGGTRCGGRRGGVRRAARGGGARRGGGAWGRPALPPAEAEAPADPELLFRNAYVDPPGNMRNG